MNELKIFNYNDMPIRTIEKDGEIWWVLKDVCGALNITDHVTTAKRLDPDEVGQTHVIDNKGRNQKTYIINEPGLYSVILRSDKPEAKGFKRWVTHEVIPSIRKTGTYTVPEAVPKLLQLPEGVSLNGLAKLLTITRRMMLDMGKGPNEIGSVAKGLLDSCGVPIAPEFYNEIPGQTILFGYPALEG